jgi:1,5-anhydro-D-fructose reductase (1,5-anhydro-D-mannitol-forming)
VSGGGYFWDLGCHTLDLLDFLLGPIAEAKGFAANQGGAYAADDTVVAALRFASGVHGTGLWSFAAADDAEVNEIVGSEGRIQFSTYMPSPIRLTRGDKCEEFPVADPPHVHQPLIQTIVDEMNGRGRCPSTGESALRTARVMDAIVGRDRMPVL